MTNFLECADVVLYADENLDKALRRWKKKVDRAGIMADLRKHRHYEKPSEKRKRKLAEQRQKRNRPEQE